MVYRRPRPAWLQKVIINPDNVPKAKSQAKLKVYLGDLETINWYDLLRAISFSTGEPALLAPVQPMGQRMVCADDDIKTISWSDLIADDLIEGDKLAPPSVPEKKIHWFLLPWQEVLTPSTSVNKPVNVMNALFMKPDIRFQYAENNQSWAQSITCTMRWQASEQD